MNSTEQSKASNVLGGKTARACDSCLLKRARWFCVADDAFLCQACDNSVHSANQLASRHERVRLETSSSKIRDSNSSPPAWRTRKARTPRHAKAASWLPPPASHQLPLVPEMNADDPFMEESDEQLFCRVPVFDAFSDDFDLNQDIGNMMMDDDADLNLEDLLSNCDAEFAADVEGLFGDGAEEDSGCRNEDLGLKTTDCQHNHSGSEVFLDGKTVKIEDKDDNDDGDDDVKAVIACHFDPALDMELNWDFDYGEAGEEKKNGAAVKARSEIEMDETQVKRRMFLRLNYEGVIAAWPTQGSPWTDGIRPQFDLEEFMVACLEGSCDGVGGRLSGRNNAGREARVSRYREKRRTRLFSKKIRYEVRKLNAEKRPRMKGRFVKRTTFSGSYQLMNK